MSPRIPSPAPSGWTAERLAASAGFQDCLAFAARALLAAHQDIPREVRYVADLQKWLLSQAGLALHFRHRLDPAAPMLSATALMRQLEGTGTASRNTVHAFLRGMLHYGLLTPAPAGPDRRLRGLIGTPRVETLITRWMLGHLAALDRMDQGDRAARLAADPGLIAQIQPPMADRLLQTPGWLHPPDGVLLFTRTESGSSILHHLLAQVPWRLDGPETTIGPVTAQDLAAQFRISQSQIARILARAGTAGLLRWDRPGRRGRCHVATALVRDYRHWQALKFAALADGLRHLDGAATDVGG